MKYLVFIVLMLAGVAGLNYPPVSRCTFQAVTEDKVTISYDLYGSSSLSSPPVVIIGHGIMVNKEMMASFAVELASHGYVVAAMDWRGHGQSTGVLEREGLYKDLEAVVKDIPSHTKADTERIALLGYSMGGSPTYQYAADHSTVKAWVGVGTAANSEISSPENPQNVLLVIAKYDEAVSPERARTSMVNLTGLPLESIEYERMYGSISEGDARRIHVVPGADHLTTPWNPEVISSATSWIVETFGGHKTSLISYYRRIFFLFIGMTGLVGLLFTVPPLLVRMLKIEKAQSRISQPLNPSTLVKKYYLVTLILLPTALVFAPLLLTPLPFTGLLTALTGGLGINLLVLSWVLTGRKTAIVQIVKENLRQNPKIWMFSVIITFIFMIGYYLLVGLHFLGMIPSTPKSFYLPLYSVILFFTFLNYSIFIQKIAVPSFRSKLNPSLRILGGVITFLLLYSWFAIVILVSCFLMDSYFFAMILILMVPIFLFMTFFSSYMEKVTESVVPSAVLHAVWLGVVTTTLTPYI